MTKYLYYFVLECIIRRISALWSMYYVVLMLSVHTWWYHRPAYIRRSGVPVPARIRAPQPASGHINYLTLICLHLTSVLDMLSLDTDTLHLIYDTWQLTCYHSLDMLSPGASTYDLILWYLTGYYYTWHLYYMAYSWLSLLRGLGMIIILWPDLWYS